MSNWYIARATNMTYEKVSLNLLDHSHWNDQQNHSAIPSALADWGFLSSSAPNVYDDTDLGRVVMSAKWHWREVLLHALTKRGSSDSNVTVRPMVVIARALLKMYSKDPQSAFLTGRSFTRLASLTAYNQLTDSFCEHLNDPDSPEETAILNYQDIWLNACAACALLEKSNGQYLLRNNKTVLEFLKLLDEHGEEMSSCPIKDNDAPAYYAYMGDISKGLPEILDKASRNLLTNMFPSFEKGTRTWASLVPQLEITIGDLVDEAEKGTTLSGLYYEKSLFARFISSLAARPFVVLSGLSGSGKTKLAQSFINWISINLLQREHCFYPGLKISRSATDLKIVSVDTVGMIVEQGTGTLVSLSNELVDHWVETIVQNGFTPATPTGTIRDKVMVEHPQYSAYMQRFDSALKPLAFYKLEHANATENMVTRLLVPVGADWTNSEKLLGYPNALDKKSYVMPDTGVLKLILDAEKNPQLPFFLILDEMNLSHVERYFADFLSAMESGDEIKLYDGEEREADGLTIPRTIKIPKNLFVIGTMNVDETTYMFSPKVLDRAQVIEFRINDKEMADFVGHLDANGNWVNGTATKIDLSQLADANGVGKGAKYAESFLKLALTRGDKKPSDQIYNDPNDPNHPDNGKVPLQEVAKELNAFFKPLAELGSEFGYRSAAEILSFTGFYLDTGATIDEAIDAAIVQKLLPKLHGSQVRLGPVIKKLKELSQKEESITDGNGENKKVNVPRFMLTCEKLDRMMSRLKANGFTSFAEA